MTLAKFLATGAGSGWVTVESIAVWRDDVVWEEIVEHGIGSAFGIILEKDFDREFHAWYDIKILCALIPVLYDAISSFTRCMLYIHQPLVSLRDKRKNIPYILGCNIQLCFDARMIVLKLIPPTAIAIYLLWNTNIVQLVAIEELHLEFVIH